MKHFVISLILFCNFTYSQDDITLTERALVEICGKIIIFDGAWVDNGVLKADISYLETMQSKAITGGYKTGDELVISPACTLYVSSILKYGDVNSKGSLVLSKLKPSVISGKCNESVTFWESIYQTNDYQTGRYSWRLDRDIDTNNADLKMLRNDSLISNMAMKKGDLVWMGECLYSIEKISLETWDNKRP